MNDSTLSPRSDGTSTVPALLGFVLAVVIAAAVGSLAAASAGSEYLALQRPTWAPPAWLFGPVWTALYATIAVSGWLVWRRSGWSGARNALAVYGLQLVLNMLWTPLFFGLGLVGLAAVEISALWLSVVATMVLFARHTRIGAALLLPYLGWVSFAAALNVAIWLLN